jgi:5,10-methylenetetrahydromethanopterin reductase
MTVPLGIHLGERFDIGDIFEVARFADEAGLDSVWIAEGRLTRDAISAMAVIASQTTRVRIASGVVNNKSRNASLMAVTAKSLDELAPGRICLGLGAWWEPLASKVGLPLVKPVKTMREYVTVVRALLAGQTVDFDGEFVKMSGVRFDSMYRQNTAVDVPIYIGAVGMRMLELAGELADGVYLDFLLPPAYLERARAAMTAGHAKRAGGRPFQITQVISCSVDDADPKAAIDECRAFLTLYLMQQPHIAEHCGVEPELVERIKQTAGWPARPEDIRRAMVHVPDSLVHAVSACGTATQAAESFARYREAGVEIPVISPLGRKADTIRALVEANA